MKKQFIKSFPSYSLAGAFARKQKGSYIISSDFYAAEKGITKFNVYKIL